MNDDLLYSMIFKRKSFHVFKPNRSLQSEELEMVKKLFQKLIPLIPDIRTEIKIVPKEKTSCKRGEYCILFYSEKKEHYLKNIGYLGAQLDLWLTYHDIGVCWYGAGKTECSCEKKMDFVIMMAIQKVSKDQFRKDMFRSKRKPVSMIWQGEDYHSIANIVRFAPSSCNLQPWYVISEGKRLNVYRIPSNKRGIMPADKVTYYQEIDIGIFLCYLDICLDHEGAAFIKELENGNHDIFEERILCATYKKSC